MPPDAPSIYPEPLEATKVRILGCVAFAGVGVHLAVDCPLCTECVPKEVREAVVTTDAIAGCIRPVWACCC